MDVRGASSSALQAMVGRMHYGLLELEEGRLGIMEHMYFYSRESPKFEVASMAEYGRIWPSHTEPYRITINQQTLRSPLPRPEHQSPASK